MQQVNLLCIPFSGGNKYSYAALEAHSLDLLRMHTWEAPGRGARFAEPLQESLESMADDLLHYLKQNIREPYAIYGHSMGSLLARLLMHRIQQEDLPRPLHLFLSGSRAISIRREPPYYHELQGEDFKNALRKLGGSPEDLLTDDEAMSIYEPIIRADFKAVETYAYQEMIPVDVPMTVFIGTEDKVTYEQAQAWEQESTTRVQVRQLKGNHFFILPHARELMQTIIRKTYSALQQVQTV